MTSLIFQLRRGTDKQLIERFSDKQVARHSGVVPSIATLFLFPFGNETATQSTGRAFSSLRMRYVYVSGYGGG